VKNTPEILFEYLRAVFYEPSKATLNIEEVDDDFIMLGKGLMYFAECFAQYDELAKALAKGDLSVKIPPPENEIASHLKSLHASLRHLTWQSQQVAKGDYKQRVDFMGDFADAFNTMIAQLAERQQKLEKEIELSHKKTLALEHSNQFLTNVTKSIPQQIIVVDQETYNVLFMNDAAQEAVDKHKEYVEEVLKLISKQREPGSRHNTEIYYSYGGEEQYLSVSSYYLNWSNSNAEAFIINDVSAEKSQIKELEAYAYVDTLTSLHNRFYGMLSLNNWLEEKRSFALVFADLDNLKYINDEFGHHEGDKYIRSAARLLEAISHDVMACRIGGDEFMLLVPDISYDEAYSRMLDISYSLFLEGRQQNKKYSFNISFGVVPVDEDNKLTASVILSMADERMYEQKRINKRKRQENSDIGGIDSAGVDTCDLNEAEVKSPTQAE